MRALSFKFDRDVSVPFTAAWRVSDDYVLPVSFKCKDYPGLLQCHLASASGSSQLVTYWRSEAHLRAQANAVKKAAALAGESWGGNIADVRAGRGRLLPTSPLDALQKAAALVGAFAVCYQAYTVLWTRPQVSISARAGDERANALENSAIQLPVVFTNHDATTQVTVESVDVSPLTGSVSIDRANRFFTIEGGKDHEVMLTGHSGDPGPASVTVVAQARSGKLRGAQTLTATLDINVWKDVELGDFDPVSTGCHDTSCRASAELRVGKADAKGLECWARIVGEPHVDIPVALTSSDKAGGERSDNGIGQSRVVKITWHEDSSEAFHRQPVMLLFKSDAALSDWRPVIRKVKGLCQPLSASTR